MGSRTPLLLQPRQPPNSYLVFQLQPQGTSFRQVSWFFSNVYGLLAFLPQIPQDHQPHRAWTVRNRVGKS